MHKIVFFYSTLGKCSDLLPKTCLHMKNVLSCKNRSVSALCKHTCDNCGPKYPKKGAPKKGNIYYIQICLSLIRVST